MTSAFSWQNSISLFPASFHIPRPNCLLLQVFLDFLLLYIVIINNATMNMRVNISFFFLSHIFESSHSIVLMSQVMIQLETKE